MTRRRETALRLSVAAALLALGYGTISGSSPTWPDSRVYAAVAFLTAGLWIGSCIDPSMLARELGDSALVSLALIRGIAYGIDLVRTGNMALLAAVSAWTLVIAVAMLPRKAKH